MATLEHVLRSAPLWVIGLAFFVALVVASQLGRLLRRLLEKSPTESESHGYLLSATLALLGLLIAFTFSLAVNRFDNRREAVINEANAITTAWMGAELVEGPAGEALRSEIRSYVDIRLQLASADSRRQVEQASARAQGEIWRHLRAALPQMQPPIAAMLVSSTATMFDAAATRKAEQLARIPGHVLNMLSLYAILSAGVVGYALARKDDRPNVLESVILFLLLTLAMTLILDLDRPWSGAIDISQQPLIDARASLD